MPPRTARSTRRARAQPDTTSSLVLPLKPRSDPARRTRPDCAKPERGSTTPRPKSARIHPVCTSRARPGPRPRVGFDRSSWGGAVVQPAGAGLQRHVRDRDEPVVERHDVVRGVLEGRGAVLRGDRTVGRGRHGHLDLSADLSLGAHRHVQALQQELGPRELAVQECLTVLLDPVDDVLRRGVEVGVGGLGGGAGRRARGCRGPPRPGRRRWCPTAGRRPRPGSAPS